MNTNERDMLVSVVQDLWPKHVHKFLPKIDGDYENDEVYHYGLCSCGETES